MKMIKIPERSFFLIAVFLMLFPSLGLVQRFILKGGPILGVSSGLMLLISYICLAIYAIVYVFSLNKVVFQLPRLSLGLNPKKSIALFGVLMSLLVLLFLLIYPLADSGKFGIGSDVDEALNIGVTEIVNGRYPYHQRTSWKGLIKARQQENKGAPPSTPDKSMQGGHLSPMPGELILATPFVVLLGNGAYQTFFWLISIFVLFTSKLKSYSAAFLVLLTSVVFSPNALHNIMTGVDHYAVGMMLFTSTLLLLSGKGNPLQRLMFGILLGLTLSARIYFILLFPLIMGALWRLSGRKVALRAAVVSGISYLAITLPFYLYDPSSFGPLMTSKILTQKMNAIIPNLSVATAALTLMLACVLPLIIRSKKVRVWILLVGLVLSVPLVIFSFGKMLVVQSVDLRELSEHAVFSYFFALFYITSYVFDGFSTSSSMAEPDYALSGSAQH